MDEDDEELRALWEAIDSMRDDLPEMVGDDWADVEAQLADLEVQAAENPDAAPMVEAQVLDLFAQHPQAHNELMTLMELLAPESHALPRNLRPAAESAPAEAAPEWAAEAAADDEAGSPAAVTRYTDIACPRRVWLETPRVSLVVRLTVQPSQYSEVVEELTLQEGLPVRVQAQSDGFDLLGPSVQEMAILPEQDSPPVVFDLRPRRAGHTLVALDFFQSSQPLGTASVEVEVTPFEVSEGAAPAPVRSLQLDPQAEAPDMVLHIAYQESSRELRLTLIRQGGLFWREFRPIPLESDPAAHVAQLYSRLATLLEGDDPTLLAVLQRRRRIPEQDVDRRVKQLGQTLWKSLIPDELKELYAAEREQWRDKALLVLSDEPHLPWELVWPYGAEGWEDEGPWCRTLRLTRWLRRDARGNGNAQPPAQLAMRSLALLAPTYSALPNLPAAQGEREALLALARSRGVADVSPAQPTWSAVMDLLEAGQYDWLHAAAHGNFYPQAPNEDSALWLQEDMALTPDSLVGPAIEGHLRAQRPAFFFNACQVGRQGWALTGMGGWANRLVSGGAGLFVGPLWEVSDDGALRFASAFYGSLLSGETLAQAAREGRLAARQSGDPTWLAYSVYGHPNARVAPSG